MAGVIWSREALLRIVSIREYIRIFDPRAARRMAERLTAAGESLAEFPDRGRPRGDGLRELPTVSPYIVIYEVGDDRIARILDIRHGRQRPRS